MFGFIFRLVGRVIGFAVKAVVFVAALVAVAAAVMVALFDGDQYKRRLAQHVVDVTGRVLAVDGPVQLQLGLPPRVVLNDVRLKNARWGTRPDMARARQVQIDVNPLAAISGGNPVGQVRIDGADVTLETNPQGEGNWESLAAVGAMAAVGILGQSASQPSQVIISNSQVTFHDGTTGHESTVALGGGAGFGIGALGPSAPVVVASADSPCDRDQQQSARAQATRPLR